MKPRWLPALGLLFLIGANLESTSAQRTEKPFTVGSEIGVTYFGGPEGWGADAYLEDGVVRFSPDGTRFAVRTERGDLALNRVEETLRFYRVQDILAFLDRSNDANPPSPAWIVNRYATTGPIIDWDWRWLADSSGVAFVEQTAGGNRQLLLADLRNKRLEPLTSARETVGEFDIRDRQHYVYTAADSAATRRDVEAERQPPSLVGTGRTLYELLYPEERASVRKSFALWAVVDGRRIKIWHNGAPVVPEESMGRVSLALSPNGASVVTELRVPSVPPSWETIYPPPMSSPFRIRVGQPASRYVRIDLLEGLVQPLTDGPTSNSGGWFIYASPGWSNDGQAIVLPGTFVDPQDGVPSRPCVAVVDLASKTNACVEILKDRDNKSYDGFWLRIYGARFTAGEKQKLVVIHNESYGLKIIGDLSSYTVTEYRRIDDGKWKLADQFKWGQAENHGGLEVSVKQGLNQPPQLVASNKQTSRVIWDPNLGFKAMELGQVRVESWKDRDGRDWNGGLYLPSDYRPGQHYPLVIQTHGFTDTQFLPSGSWTTAFAARALASIGIAVLQVGEPCPLASPDEGPCAVSGYEAGVNKLVSEGLVDPEKIGIIGFSRTCFYVMETLTTSSLHIKAASISDGQMMTYLQFLVNVGFQDSNISRQMSAVVGAEPFGEGLQEWVKRSPGFNLNKINAPLLVVATDEYWSLLNMWEPYAGLHFLSRPVDLIKLNTTNHVLTNPALRIVSEGDSVDWFRFWLQDYEDPDPAKKEQYERWRGLKKMQEENEAKARAEKN